MSDTTEGTFTVGELLTYQHQQRRAARDAVQAGQPRLTNPADRQPTLDSFRGLQANVDGAYTALHEAIRDGARKSVIAECEQRLALARENVNRAVDAAPDPMAARACATFAGDELDRPTRPATVGDKILEGASVSKGRERYLTTQVQIMEDLDQLHDERDHPEKQAQANRELLIGQLQALRDAQAEANPEALGEG